MIEELKARYRRGGLGDTTVKRHLEDVLQALLAPIRERRARYAADPAFVMDVLRRGTSEARALTQATLEEVRDGLGLFSFAAPVIPDAPKARAGNQTLQQG
jgi:tryptophanyl-tRNA synthetase